MSSTASRSSRIPGHALFWVIVAAAVVYAISLLPLGYYLTSSHGAAGLSSLWGLAPNQFFFIAVVLPFAATASFVAFYDLAFTVRPQLPPGSSLTKWLSDWQLLILVGFIFAAIVSMVVYKNATWSPDKLQPRFASMHVAAMEEFEKEIEGQPQKKRAAWRELAVAKAKEDMGAAVDIPPAGSPADAVDTWLSGKTAAFKLQVLSNRELVLQLRIVDETAQAFAILQLFVVVFCASMTLFAAGLSLYAGFRYGFNGDLGDALRLALLSTVWSVFFFSVYSLCFGQYRRQIEYYVGSGSTILQDVLVGFLVGALLLGLAVVDPNNRTLDIGTALKYLPLLIFGSSAIAERQFPDLFRRLIGQDVTLGTGVLLSVVVVLIGAIPMAIILLRSP